MSDISTDAMMRESAMMDASNNHVWARKVRRLCIERDKLKAQIAALPPAPDAPAWKGNDAFCASLRNAPKNAFKHAPAPDAVQAMVAEAVAQERERIIARLELAAGVYLDRASDTIQTNPLSATPTGKPTEDQLAAYDYDNMQAMLDGAAAVALRQEITAIRAGGKP